MKTFKKFVTGIVALCMLISIVPIAAAAPSKPTLKEPIKGQIIPFYEVWIRWNDVSNEDHYIMTIRDITNGDSGPLIYNRQRVSKNSTYFIIPTSKLTKGHTYRWCLGAVDSAGNETLCPAWTFRLEYGDSINAWDTHIGKGGFASASHLDYFVYATTPGYGDILQAGVEAWNGISSNVHLHRDYNPPGGNYDLGIFESPIPADNDDIFGECVPRVGGQNGTALTDLESEFDFAEVRTYRQNIINKHPSTASTYYFKSNASHEVGHALSLYHTDDSSNSVAHTIYQDKYTANPAVKLIMNSGDYLADSIKTTDRDHLRIKWGA